MMVGVRVPQRLDDSERILFWTLDEFLGMMFGLGFGMVAFNAVVGLPLGISIWLILRKLKSGSGLKQLIRYVFWHGGSDHFGIVASPPPYIRNWVL